MLSTALFAGSFDPFTAGHQAVTERALEIFDRVAIGVGCNTAKSGFLPPQRRVELIADLYRDNPRVEVFAYTGLTGQAARQRGIRVLVRGLRSGADFEFERSTEALNRRLFPEIATVFVCTPPELAAVSSSAVREITAFGGDAAGLMPDGVDLKKYL